MTGTTGHEKTISPVIFNSSPAKGRCSEGAEGFFYINLKAMTGTTKRERLLIDTINMNRI